MYQSPKARQHEEGRSAQREQVADILASMSPFSRPPTKPRQDLRWSNDLQRWVDLNRGGR